MRVLAPLVLGVMLAVPIAHAQVAMPFTTWHVEGKTVGKTTRFELVVGNHGGAGRSRVRRIQLGTVPATKHGACRSGLRVANELTETVTAKDYGKLGSLVRDHLSEHFEGSWPRADGTGMEVHVARCERDTPQYAVFIHDQIRDQIAVLFVADDALIDRATGYRPAAKRKGSPFIYLGKTPHGLP